MDVAFQKMQSSVSKYARANDRRMVLRTLKEVKHLDCIPLDPIEENLLARQNLSDLEQEVSRERIILNDMPFVQKKKNGNYDFLVTLQELCFKLCEDPQLGGSSLDPNYLYEQLIIRMAPTSSSADAHFKLNSLLGSPDLMLMPCQPHLHGPVANGTTAPKALQEQMPPIQLQVFASGGQIHATILTAHGFGLFRKVDVKPDGGRPWIYLQALTRERVNFNNRASVRSMRLKLPSDLY